MPVLRPVVLIKTIALVMLVCCYCCCLAQRRSMQEYDSALQSLMRPRAAVGPRSWTMQAAKPLSSVDPRKYGSVLRTAGLPAVCHDTSGRQLFLPDSFGTLVGTMTHLADGNVIVPTLQINSITPYNLSNTIVKFTPQGDTLWTQVFGNDANGYLARIINVFELSDHSLLATGSMDVPTPVNTKEEMLVMKLSPTGHLIWQKTYASSVWASDTTNGLTDVNAAASAPNGDILFCGTIRHGGMPRSTFMARLSSDGNLLWARGYANNGWPQGIGFLQNGGNIQLFGSDGFPFCVTVDPATGHMLSTRGYVMTGPNTAGQRSLKPQAVVQLNNGNIALYGHALGDFEVTAWDGWFYHTGWLELSPDLMPLHSYLLRSTVAENPYGTVFTMYPDGTAAYAHFQFTSANYNSADVLVGKVIQGNIVKERVISYNGNSPSFRTNFVQLSDGADLFAQTTPTGPSHTNYGIELIRLHLSDTSGSCLGTDQYITSIIEQPYALGNPGLSELTDSVLYETQLVPVLANYRHNPLHPLYPCQQVSHCDTLKLKPSAQILCSSTALQIVVEKNAACGSRPVWDYDTTHIQSFGYVNDSTVEVHFNGDWKGRIKATLYGCTPLMDSVPLIVTGTPAAPELGADTSICPGNHIMLSAHKGFATYQWQDGTTDSTLSLSQPGTYWVNVRDACGNAYSDTVFVIQAPRVTVSIGPDRSKCNADTLHLQAPDGFLHYQWGPDYAISSTSTQAVVVQPLADTVYYVQAEKTPGCFAYDTIKVTVNHAAAIDLGHDRSFCYGDSAVFDAGSGFAHYLWNTGDTTEQLTAQARGTYWVAAANINGCVSHDTVSVLHVYPLPVVQLPKDSAICAGTSLLLDAGPGYASYTWSNNTHAQSISVIATGTYAVTVKDKNGCMGQDTTTVRSLFIPPQGFLPADTAICTYSSLDIRTVSTFNSYLWSNGANTPSITIFSPGEYWLEVRDQHSCVGKDTIVVSAKQCMEGLYVPNAFYPASTVGNNVFRPLLYGNIKSIAFTVYNRYGAMIFHTTTPGSGWDGTINGTPQKADVFVWTCRYQLEGAPEKTAKGTVMLVR